MVAGRHKSHSLRKVPRRTPGARISVQYKKRKPSSAECNKCGSNLTTVPRERPFKMENLPKTQKRPERPFGGVLCSKCASREIIKRSRESAKTE